MKQNVWLMTAVKIIILAMTTVAVLWSVSNNYMIKTSAAAQMVDKPAPSIQAKKWLNATELTNEMLRGKVYLVEFWTFGCYNCVNVEPYVKQWHNKYKSKGFEVVSVHSPEFAHEKDIDNVRDYVKRKSIHYPVAIDNDFSIWNRFNNRYWPAMYLVDKKGIIRYTHFGEGRYSTTEAMINILLSEK